MKKYVIQSVLLLLSFVHLNCSSGETYYYQYEPDYEGYFVNSAEKQRATYLIDADTFFKNDSLHRNPFYGGYHLAKPIKEKFYCDNKFTVLAYPDSFITLKQIQFSGYAYIKNKITKGFRVLILNNSNDTVDIKIQGYTIKMIQEALNPNGKWIPIEYWVNSFCGNAYGTAYFPPGTMLETTAFKYRGTFKTKLRFKLCIEPKSTDGIYKKNYIYSEPFEGSVNYSQLGRSKPYGFTEYLE